MSKIITNADIGALFHVEPKPQSREKIRPLGALSDYVADQFSDDLNNVQGAPQLAQKIDRIISGCRFQVPKSELGVARLDVMMLEAGLRAHGAKCGSFLENLVRCFSNETGQKPILSYQDIILYNPPGDIRTFTDGACGKQEADFYIGHQMIESCLWRCHHTFTTIH